MNLLSPIYVAGHEGLVGSAICRQLQLQGYQNIITESFNNLDLRNTQATEQFIKKQQPEYIFLAAARVGGIVANMNAPAEFIYDNLMIAANVIHAAYKYNVKKLLFLGSSCIYPKSCPQPIAEEYLLSSPLEPTNEYYALAKIAGLKMCQAYNKQYKTNFIACMPTNLYGPFDNFDLQTSHVLPALLRKFYDATLDQSPIVAIWGTGTPRREFLFVDDLAQATIFLMNNYNSNEIVNIGTGSDVSIKELALTIANIVGFEGTLEFDASKPDGTPQKLLNINKIKNLGWTPKISLEEGIHLTFDWFKKTKEIKHNATNHQTQSTTF